MIQVKNNYQPHEMYALSGILFEALGILKSEVCLNEKDCTTCGYRNLCKDMERVVDYTKKLAEKEGV